MKKFYLSLIAIAFLATAIAQQSTFRTQYNFSQFDIPTGMAQAPSGGNYIFSSSVVSGFSLPIGPKGGLTEVDHNGNHVRSTLYNNGTFTTSVDLQDVKNATAGGYIVTGDANSQCLIAKIPAAFGAPTWQYRYLPVSGASASGTKVIQASDGGFVVAGTASHVNNGTAMTDSLKMFAIKVDANGTVVWSKVFFYTTAFDDDDYLNGVTETADGYVFVGSVTTSANDGPSDAVVIKTDVSGNLQWARKFGSSGNSEDVESVITDTGNEIVMSGVDNLGGYIYNWSAPNSGPSVIGTFNTKYTSAGLPVSVGNLTKTADNNFAVFASGATFANFTTLLVKVSRANGNVLFDKSYNSFISILPTGIQAADSGFLMNSLSADTAGNGGYDFGVTKTDINGNQGNGSSCSPTSPTIIPTSYNPTVSSFTPIIPTLTNVRSSGGVSAVNGTPGVVISCRTIACTPPPTPTVTSTGNNICPGTAVTINASGGSSVTYHIYTQASGGTSIGNAPLSVSPSTTTTYYVEADDNNNPGCVSSRGNVTVTVIQPPTNVGSIVGSANPCLGSANYSIAATGATNYVWSVSGGGTITGGQGSSAATINWTSSGGPYTVSVVVSSACGSTTQTLTVNVVAGVSGVGASASANPCVGGTLTLTGAGNGVNNWAWTGPNGFTSNSQSPQILNLTTAASGTYNLTASSTCGSGTASVPVTVGDVPQNVTASANPSTICAGNTINLTGGGTNATSWSWTGPNNFTASTQNASVTNAQQVATGTYTLTATNVCGNATATANVTVNTVPTAVSASANPNPVCAGSALNLSGGATGAASYAWTGPGSYTSAQLNNTISNFQNANAGTYILTATNTCGSTQDAVLITIATVPTSVTATANLTNICSNANLILNGNANDASSFSWTGPNGFTSTSQNPTIANVILADSGLYTLTATNACGNSTATVNVDVDTVIQNLSVNASPNDTVCAGATINLSGSGTQVNTWSWSGPGSYTSNQQNPSISNTTAANSGTYTVTATNACGSSTASLSVLVNIPISGLTATATTGAIICNGTTISLTANGTNINNYTWSGPNGFSSTQQNPTIANATVAATGTYTVTGNNACANQSATVSVEVDTLIENLSSSASPNDTICAGGTVNLNANGTNVNTWSWTGPNAFTSTQQNPSVTSAIAANSGDYIVTGSNACGSASDTITVLVNTIPLTPSTINGSLTACGNDTATYSVSNVPNATAYTWTVSGGGTIVNGQGTTSIDVSWGSSSGTYTVSVTASNNCGGSAASSITVNLQAPVPIMNSVIVGDTGVCPGIQPYSISAIPNATGYTWSIDGGGAISSGQGTTAVNVDWTTAGTHIVNVIATNSCGNSSAATLSVNVHPSPTAPTVNLQNDSTTICEGDPITITATNSTGGIVSYNFYDAATGGNIVGTTPLTVSPTVTTVYYLEVINQFGCTGSNGRIPVTVNVTRAPTVLGITSTGDTVCYGSSATLTANVSPAGTTVTWWDNAAAGNVLGTGSSYTTTTLNQTTTFYASATSSSGCQNLQGRVPATVTVVPLPVVTLISDKDHNTIFPNEVITFTAIPDSLDSYEFFWNGSSVQVGTSNTWSSSKINDLDTVWVIATNSICQGLRSEDTVHVVDFPNAFTPNNDGVNDVFLKGYELIITNRWGQTLYEGREGWDGKYKGDKVSPGTYYYIVTLDNITDRKNAIKGTVLLIED